MTGIALMNPTDILRSLADDLDVPPEQRQALIARYDDLGRWLEDVAHPDRDITVYAQGSMAINTTTCSPVDGRCDLDGVFRIAYLRSEIDKVQLKAIAGGYLDLYVRTRQDESHPLAPSGLSPKRRAWTLSYADGFHLDYLPVIIDDKARPGAAGDPVLLADKALARWQSTNPKGFAEWFNMLSEDERYARRLREAEARKVDVE